MNTTKSCSRLNQTTYITIRLISMQINVNPILNALKENIFTYKPLKKVLHNIPGVNNIK